MHLAAIVLAFELFHDSLDEGARRDHDLVADRDRGSDLRVNVISTV